MTVIYFDECKDDPKHGRPWYIVGGLLVESANLRAVEDLVGDIAFRVFKSRELIPETEFHGKDIFNGKAAFKGAKIDDRLAVLDRLLEIIENDGLVRRAYAAIRTDKLKAYARAPSFAFGYFVERAQRALKTGETGLLIADLDDQQAGKMVADFQKYRASGTPFAHGVDINCIAGSVNFTRSHHSRLMQLADVYVYAVANDFAPRGGYAGNELTKLIGAREIYAHSYKRWEPE